VKSLRFRDGQLLISSFPQQQSVVRATQYRLIISKQLIRVVSFMTFLKYGAVRKDVRPKWRKIDLLSPLVRKMSALDKPSWLRTYFTDSSYLRKQTDFERTYTL